MKTIIVFLFILVTLVNASETEKLFWDEVKNSNDIEMLKLYKKKYPNGIFEPLADLKIKRLLKSNRVDKNIKNEQSIIPLWIKGYTDQYKYYGVGKANKHFKGDEYQKTLAIKRAKRELVDKLEESGLDQEKIDHYLTLTQIKEYKNYRERLFILIYIDND